MAPPKKSTAATPVATTPVVVTPAPAPAVPKARATKAAPAAAAPAKEVASVVPEAAAPKKRATKAVVVEAEVVAAPKKRAAKAVASPTSVIINAKPATTPSGETVTLTKTKRTKKVADPNTPPRSSPYNEYMKKYLPLEKAKAQSTLAPGAKVDHKQIFRLVASNWKTSAEAKAAAASRPVAASA